MLTYLGTRNLYIMERGSCKIELTPEPDVASMTQPKSGVLLVRLNPNIEIQGHTLS